MLNKFSVFLKDTAAGKCARGIVLKYELVKGFLTGQRILAQVWKSIPRWQFITAEQFSFPFREFGFSPTAEEKTEATSVIINHVGYTKFYFIFVIRSVLNYIRHSVRK